MLARTTLAILLAVPAATAVLVSPHSASAESSGVCKENCAGHSHRPTRRGPTERSPWAERSTVSRRRGAAYAQVVTVSRLFPGPDADAATVGASDAASEAATGKGGQALQVGLASWYGGARWQGHMTSSGNCYDENLLTAAHASLPLGSQAMVRLVGSDRNVIVTITDRPGTRRRVIDLSRAAAAKLGILSRGIAEVSIEPL